MKTDIDETLAYWFADSADSAEKASARNSVWFGASAETDDEVRRRFGELVLLARNGELGEWQRSPRGSLAFVILLDQFTRNIYRGSAEAFSADDRALRVAKEAIASGQDQELPLVYRAFLHLPFEHSESLADQEHCLELGRRLASEAPAEWKSLMTDYVGYAESHHEVIARFGRFPHRNAVLGRQDTAEEAEYLENADRYGQ